MRELRVRLRSSYGDALGHLVRAVQMLGSYGDEWRLISVSDVRHCYNDPACLEVMVDGRTDTTPEQWEQIEREVRWSLGADEHSEGTLEMGVMQVGQPGAYGEIVIRADEFRELCQWGHTEGLTPPDGGGEAQPSL